MLVFRVPFLPRQALALAQQTGEAGGPGFPERRGCSPDVLGWILSLFRPLSAGAGSLFPCQDALHPSRLTCWVVTRPKPAIVPLQGVGPPQRSDFTGLLSSCNLSKAQDTPRADYLP